MNLDETRNGILKCLENKGSTAPMKVLHGYSKLIHQVAHREFSEVMEGCLLYTSPSPRDKRQSRMPSSA